MASMSEPAMLGHMRTFYQALLDIAPDGAFTGFPTKVFAQTGLPSSYYAPIRRGLVDMDCIRPVKRGARSVPSEWMLLREPTLELLALMPGKGSDPNTIERLRHRVLHLQEHVNDLQSELGEAANRIERLEKAYGDKIKTVAEKAKRPTTRSPKEGTDGDS